MTYLKIGFPRDVEPFHVARGPAISPDGRTVALIGVKDGIRSLFVRRLDRAEATEIPATVSASQAAFSPDSSGVAVIVGGGSLMRVGLADQQRRVLASGADVNGALVWSPIGIVFAQTGALWIVSPEGGAPRAITVLDAARHEVAHDHPVVPPGERLVLFASQTAEPGGERIDAIPIDGGQRTVVVERATSPVWSPTAICSSPGMAWCWRQSWTLAPRRYKAQQSRSCRPAACRPSVPAACRLRCCPPGPCFPFRPASLTRASFQWAATGRPRPTCCHPIAMPTLESHRTAARS